MIADLQTVVLGGQRFVILPEAEFQQLAGGLVEPQLPEPDRNGNYPAVETMRVMLAQKIIRRRRAVGLSQAELARRAGIRNETLNRLEQGKHTPSLATADKLDRALCQAETARRARDSASGGRGKVGRTSAPRRRG
jgi:DNA-binding XRE family transcriptional regulator